MWRTSPLPFLLCSALVTLACSGEDGSRLDAPVEAPPPRDLLLITVDTLRADALGFAGNDRVQTPTLDALAAAGRVFPNAHAHNVVTLPSHANLLTGLYPYQHGVRNNAGFELGAEPATLAELLKRAGFATAAVVGAFPLDSRFGLDRGFDLYDDDFGDSGAIFQYAERPGDAVVASGRQWWEGHRGQRRFLWLHLFDPHAPYEAPQPYASRASHPYLGEVEAVDAFLTPLLAPLLEGAEATALIAFTSDHGEALGAHGEETHGFFAYEPTLRVPLVLWGPGVAPGVDEREAQHVDLLPTLLEAVGVAVPDGLPGRSLLAPAPSGRPTYFESLSPNLELGAAPLRGVLRAGAKLIDVPVTELYDLEGDPDESRNLFAERRALARDLRQALPAESSWPPAAEAVSPEEAERLRSLGYVASSAPRRERYGPADDPKNLLDLRHRLNRIAVLQSRGQAAAALALGRETLDAHPAVPAVYEYVVKIHLERNELAPALELLQRAQSEGATNSALNQQLARTLVRLGRPERALAVIEGLEPEFRDTGMLQETALALARLGKEGEALTLLEGGVERDPADAGAWESLSYVASQVGAFERASRAARRAVEIDPSRADAWNNLGVASYQLDRTAEALGAWKRAATLDPRNPDVLFNLGLAAEETGDLELARRSLERFLEIAPELGLDAQKQAARALMDRLGASPPR